MSGMHASQAAALQVLEEWVAERDLEEVLHIMGEARVPSGGRSCIFLGRFGYTLKKLLFQPVEPSAAPNTARLTSQTAGALVAMHRSQQCHETHLHRQAFSLPVQMSFQPTLVCAGPILSTADILREEQYQVRGMFEQTAPPSSAGPTITVPAMVPVLSRTPGSLQDPSLAPSLTADVIKT